MATVWIGVPRLEICAASQIERKVEFLSGANGVVDIEFAPGRATLHTREHHGWCTCATQQLQRT